MADTTPEVPPVPEEPVDQSGEITSAAVPGTGTPDGAEPSKKKKKRRKKKRRQPSAGTPAGQRPAMPPEAWWQKLIIRVLLVGVLVLAGLAGKVWLIDLPAQAKRTVILTEFHSHADEFRRLAMQSTLEVRGLDQIDTPEKAALFRESLPRAKDLMIRANDHYEKALGFAQEWKRRYTPEDPGSAEMSDAVQTLQSDYMAFLDTANQLDRAAKMLASSNAADSPELPALPEDNGSGN